MLLHKTPINVISQSKVKGNMFGIELECEFPVQLPDGFLQNAKGYKVVPDGSLRGNGLEFISPPISLLNKGHMTRLGTLCEDILRLGGPQNSPRTSTHVHQNWGSNTFGELFTFLSVYTLVEPVLLCMSGDYRIGNNFCLSFSQAPAGFDKFTTYAKEVFWNTQQNSRNHKYSALHVGNLAKLGTIEFRSMKGIHSTEQIMNWLKTLDALKEYSLTFKSPAEVKERFDRIGYVAFVSEAILDPDPVLGSHSEIEEAIARFYTYVESSSDNWTWNNDWRHNPKQCGINNFSEVYASYVPYSTPRMKQFLYGTAEKDKRKSMPNIIGDFIDDTSPKKESLFDSIPVDYQPKFYDLGLREAFEDPRRDVLEGLANRLWQRPPAPLQVAPQLPAPQEWVVVEEEIHLPIPDDDEEPQFHDDDEDEHGF